MLTEVCLRNFKNHVATTVKPGRMTCLVGPNGCGKTSVLEAIQLVSVSINSGAAAFTNRGRPLSDLVRKGASTLTVDAVLACDEAAEPWLRLSLSAEPDLFATLMQRIRDVLPQVERLRTRPAKVALNEPAQVSTRGKEIHYLETREVIGHELLFDLKDAPGIPARAVSEGTLLVTALLTATVWNQGADLLLIDDLEKGLHPKAQRELVTALKRLQEVDPNLQVMFSTHSPYIVDELTAEQVWILVADDARGVVARRLRDHPRAADALQVLTTGEFLDAEGEDWVRDAPDAP